MTLWGAVTTELAKEVPQPGANLCDIEVDLDSTTECRPCLSEGIRGLYQRCQFYDLVVVAAGKRFPAHQVALAATSPALRDSVVEALRCAAAPTSADAAGTPEAPRCSGAPASEDGAGPQEVPRCSGAPASEDGAGAQEVPRCSGAPASEGGAGPQEALDSASAATESQSSHAPAPRERPAGQPELHLEHLTNPEAARALLDYVYGLDGTYQVTSDEANRDVLRLAQRFGLARLEERAARWMAEGLCSSNVVHRLAICQEFGLADLYALLEDRLVASGPALLAVAGSTEVMEHPSLLQHLLIKATGKYIPGAPAADAPLPLKRPPPTDAEGWTAKHAKVAERLAHVGA